MAYPYIKSKLPPPNQIMTFTLRNFAKGLNNRSEVLEPGECSDVKNMSFTDDDVMEKRRGTTYFDELLLQGGELVHIDEFRPYDDTDIMVRATKSEMYIGNTKVADLSGKTNGINFSGKYFFTDSKKLRAYGKFTDAASTYIRHVGTKVEDYILMEVVTPPEGFTPLAVEHKKGVRVYDYTNRKVWYEPCKNEIEDTFKQGNVIPANPRFLVVHGGRLFVSGDDKDDDNVFISDVNNPYYFPASLPMQLPPNSDRVAGLIVYDDAVVVGRKRDMHAITGSTNRTDAGVPVFRLEKINTHTGVAHQKSMNVAHNYMFFVGSDGHCYALNNAQNAQKVLSTQLLTRQLDMFRSPVDLKKSDIYESQSIFFEDNWYVGIGDKMLIYSYVNRGWTLYEGIKAKTFYAFYNVLLWGDEKGRTCMPSDDHLDHGEPYEAYWKSGNFDMEDAHSFKHFREFFIVARSHEKFSSDINVMFEIDYSDVSSGVSIKNKLSVWGRAVWGDRFISRNINASEPFRIGRRGRNIRFTFSNGYDREATLATIADLATYLKPRQNMMVFVTENSSFYLYDNAEWRKLVIDDLNQGMCVYQMNGEYEYRGKR